MSKEYKKNYTLLNIGRHLCNIFFHTFYKVEYKGIENIPKEGAVIIFSKHWRYADIPLENSLISTIIGRYSNFPMKAGIPPQKILIAFGGFPVYRREDIKEVLAEERICSLCLKTEEVKLDRFVKLSRLDKEKAYDILKRFETKGLISSYVKEGTTYFRARDNEVLEKILEEKKRTKEGIRSTNQGAEENIDYLLRKGKEMLIIYGEETRTPGKVKPIRRPVINRLFPDKEEYRYRKDIPIVVVGLYYHEGGFLGIFRKKVEVRFELLTEEERNSPNLEEILTGKVAKASGLPILRK